VECAASLINIREADEHANSADDMTARTHLLNSLCTFEKQTEKQRKDRFLREVAPFVGPEPHHKSFRQKQEEGKPL
jgi:hypothetical protein